MRLCQFGQLAENKKQGANDSALLQKKSVNAGLIFSKPECIFMPSLLRFIATGGGGRVRIVTRTPAIGRHAALSERGSVMIDDFGLPRSQAVFLILGVWCLVAGRRSLALIAGVVAFYLGGRLAKFYWVADSPFFIVLFAVFAGLAGFVLAKVSRTAALSMAAF